MPWVGMLGNHGLPDVRYWMSLLGTDQPIPRVTLKLRAGPECPALGQRTESARLRSDPSFSPARTRSHLAQGRGVNRYNTQRTPRMRPTPVEGTRGDCMATVSAKTILNQATELSLCTF